MKDDSEYIKKLASSKPTEESRANADKAAELIVILNDIEALKTYAENSARAKAELEKAKIEFKKFRTNRRLKRVLTAAAEYGRIEVQHGRTDIAEYESKLREYEKIIPEKFLNEKSLRKIEMSLRFGLAKSVEEAVKILEERTTE